MENWSIGVGVNVSPRIWLMLAFDRPEDGYEPMME
jgi:hypothetical protein